MHGDKCNAHNILGFTNLNSVLTMHIEVSILSVGYTARLRCCFGVACHRESWRGIQLSDMLVAVYQTTGRCIPKYVNQIRLADLPPAFERGEGKLTLYKLQLSLSPLGTVRPLYRTGVSLLSRERFLYI